jgi:GT2 family glycosyltransferase
VIAVVIASHGRALRLRWLLNALETQAVPFEGVVVHDYDARERARLLDTHPLVVSSAVRLIAIPPGTGSPAGQRNIGWRATRAPLVAFIDDDCRPETDWLRALEAVAYERPGAVLQGATRPDPWERELMAAPHVRTMTITPPTTRLQTCNVLYPRALLERLGGFDEGAVVGEDVDLGLRARAAGAQVAAVPDALVNHAVEAFTLPGIVRQNWKWRHLPWLLARHPEMRRECTWGLFWERRRAWLALALAGALGSRVWRPLAVLALPYLRALLERRGRSLVGRAVAVAEVPGQVAVDVAELGTYAAGSLRYRTPVL